MQVRFSTSSIKDLVAKKYFFVFLLGFGLLLRFLFFKSQIWLGSDITRDIAISLEGLKRNEIPSTGSFSSAGPFVFGPAIYWVYMIAFIIFPFSLLTPWFSAVAFSILAFFAFYLLAKSMGDRIFTLTTVLIVALSPQMILSAGTPTQHIYVLVFTLLAIVFLFIYWKSKNIWTCLLSGICIGMSINMHYQAVNLVVLPLVVLFFEKQTFIKKFVAFVVLWTGLFIALLPLTIWDSGQDFANYRNLFDYLLIGQSRVYVPNSWKLYLFGYLPNYWSFVTGLPPILGISIFFAGIILTLRELLVTKRLSFLVLLNFVFLFMVFIGRYYRGERFPGYTIYLLPFMILFSAWTISQISKQLANSKINAIFLIVVVISVVYTSFSILSTHTGQNSSLDDVRRVTGNITLKYPDRNFKVLNLSGTNPDASFAMAAYLKNQKLYSESSDLGLAFCVGCKEAEESIGALFGVSYFVIDTKNLDTKWQVVSQAGIFDSNTSWLNQHQLKSTFYPDKYLKEKFSK